MAITVLAAMSFASAATATGLDACLAHAADRFDLPQALLAAVREQEAGRVGGWHVNPDGSIDYGVMQINSRWLPRLAPLGYSARALTYDGCASISAGAWILSQAMVEAGVWRHTSPEAHAYWRAVGMYHSHTPTLNRIYAEKVWARYARISSHTSPMQASVTDRNEAGTAGLAVSAASTGTACNAVTAGESPNVDRFIPERSVHP